MFSARVISGKGRGKVLGFPTLNLEIPENFDIQQGIYSCVTFIDEKRYKGALHWGPIPVFNHAEKSLEIFVLDWDGVKNPERVSFEIGKYLRPIQNFPNPKALSAQITTDVANIRSS